MSRAPPRDRRFHRQSSRGRGRWVRRQRYASSKAGAEKVVTEIVGAGGRAVAIRADVAKKTEIDRLFAESQKAFGPLDILVNNAGTITNLSRWKASPRSISTGSST